MAHAAVKQVEYIFEPYSRSFTSSVLRMELSICMIRAGRRGSVVSPACDADACLLEVSDLPSLTIIISTNEESAGVSTAVGGFEAIGVGDGARCSG